MTRWSDDPERAADALIGSVLDDISLEGQVLLVNQGGVLPARMAERGFQVTTWNRRLPGIPSPTPWPPAGPFDMALVRLPKARDEQDMTIHATMSVLAAGGRLILYGGNDEGIRSAQALLEALGGPAETMAARGHGRVMTMRRPDIPRGLKPTLADWRIETAMAIAGITRAWITYPGVFAAGRLDEGTALLLGTLTALPPLAHVLDYGCGSGVIGAAALALNQRMTLDMLDSDSVALEAARDNLPGARAVLGTSLKQAPRRHYDAILSNPPLHRGITEDREPLERLIADAPSHLAPGGILQIVVQRRVPLDRLIGRHLVDADVLAENSRYRVWKARQA